MQTFLALYPADWRYTPTLDKLDELVQLWIAEGVLAAGSRVEDAARSSWEPGPGIARLIPVGDILPYSLSMTTSDEPMASAGSDLGVWCPACRAQVDGWDELMQELYETQQEPDYRCSTCGTATPFTKLDADVGLAIARFMITLGDVEVFPDHLDQIRRTPIFQRMEQILGVELRFALFCL